MLGGAAIAAATDWIAVARRPTRVESFAKPLALVLLVAFAVALHPDDAGQRAWIVVALVCSLAGDVLLLPAVDRFVPGLAAFLAAHVAYIVGFVVGGIVLAAIPVAAVLVALVAVPLGRRLLAGARASGNDAVVAPVVAYVVVIATMVVAALAAADRVAVAGALLFMSSDALIGWTRFVQPIRWAPVTIMVTYHVGQALLVASLVT